MAPTLPYELHVTVAEGQAGLFIEACEQLGVKPLLIVAQVNAEDGTVLKDLQTSSIVKGSWQDVCNELTYIRQGLEAREFKVIREKVETTPFHPDAPRVHGKSLVMPAGCYFETHIPVAMEMRGDTALRYQELNELARRHGAHLSRNAFKAYEDGNLVFMITLRDSLMHHEGFEWAKYKLEDELYAEGFVTDIDASALIEFVCYDSNVEHDNAWLRKGPPSSFNTKKLDGPLDRSKMTLESVDPNDPALSEVRIKRLHERFGLTTDE
jgi:hypothetical protein